MKKNKWLIIGAVGVVAYLWWKNKKKKASASAEVPSTNVVEEVMEEVEQDVNDDLLG